MSAQTAVGAEGLTPIVLAMEAAERRHRLRFRVRFILTWVVILGAVALFLAATVKINVDFLLEWLPFIVGGVWVTPERREPPDQGGSSVGREPSGELLASAAIAIGRWSAGSASTSARVVTPVSINTQRAPTACAAARSVAIPSPIMIGVADVPADGLGGQLEQVRRGLADRQRDDPRSRPRPRRPRRRRPVAARAPSGRSGRGSWR